MIFTSDDGDERALLKQDGDNIPIIFKDPLENQQGKNQCTIRGVYANEEEDKIFCITSSGQLLSAAIELNTNGVGNNDDTKFDFVMGPFHRSEITGLDVCIRKELIATCSKDKSVRIWNYAQKTHEIS